MIMLTMGKILISLHKTTFQMVCMILFSTEHSISIWCQINHSVLWCVFFVLNRTIPICFYTTWIIHVRSPHMCAYTKSGPGFLMSYGLVLFYVQWFDVRCHCCYLWNRWPSLFKLSSLIHAFLFDKRYPLILKIV